MKKNKIHFERAFSLDKETVTKLNEEQMGEIAGGQDTTPLSSCNVFSCNPDNCAPVTNTADA